MVGSCCMTQCVHACVYQWLAEVCGGTSCGSLIPEYYKAPGSPGGYDPRTQHASDWIYSNDCSGHVAVPVWVP